MDRGRTPSHSVRVNSLGQPIGAGGSDLPEPARFNKLVGELMVKGL